MHSSSLSTLVYLAVAVLASPTAVDQFPLNVRDVWTSPVRRDTFVKRAPEPEVEHRDLDQRSTFTIEFSERAPAEGTVTFSKKASGDGLNARYPFFVKYDGNLEASDIEELEARKADLERCEAELAAREAEENTKRDAAEQAAKREAEEVAKREAEAIAEREERAIKKRQALEDIEAREAAFEAAKRNFEELHMGGTQALDMHDFVDGSVHFSKREPQFNLASLSSFGNGTANGNTGSTTGTDTSIKLLDSKPLDTFDKHTEIISHGRAPGKLKRVTKNIIIEFPSRNKTDDVEHLPEIDVDESTVLKEGPSPGTKYHSLDKIIIDIEGFTGVFPKHEFEIIKRPQGLDHLCSMAGDGANDAPAPSLTTIGITIEGATDTASGVTDIVLTKPGLLTIVQIIRGSHIIFQRMHNYTIYACIVTICIVVCFAILAFRYKFEFSSFMVLIIVLLNDSTILTLSVDRVLPSNTLDFWALAEIFVYIITDGLYLTLSLITHVIIIIKETTSFQDKFGVTHHTLPHPLERQTAALDHLPPSRHHLAGAHLRHLSTRCLLHGAPVMRSRVYVLLYYDKGAPTALRNPAARARHECRIKGDGGRWRLSLT
ncbi:unnamed protein product [Peniophora sp. CBMAI 1063]|nr:unnamed protein product [Peniophora sp. CBMAI 1063]